MDFDLGNLGGMFAMFQQRMQQFKDEAAKLRCEGTAGGGMVKVTVSGTYECLSVEIAEEAMQDRELLEDLVRAANDEAMRKVRDHMAQQLQSLTGGLPIPPGLMPF